MFDSKYKLAVAVATLGTLGSLYAAVPNGIGKTVAECNGAATLTTVTPGQDTIVEKVPAVTIWGRDSVVGLAHTVFAYLGVPQIEHRTLPLVGKRGVYQMRLALPTSSMPPPPKIGDSYEGMFLLSQWNEGSQSWSSIGGAKPSVKITRYDLSEAAWNSTDAMCAGSFEGTFSVAGKEGSTLTFAFVAPVLTKNFPQ